MSMSDPMWPFSSDPVVDVALAQTSHSGVQTRDVVLDVPPVGIRPPRRNVFDTAVSVDDALSLATAFRCISLLSTMISGLPLIAERGGAPMKSVPAILRRPSLDEPLRDVLAGTVGSLATTGNAYWLTVRGGPAEPVSSIAVLDPASVVVDIDPSTGTYDYRRLVAGGRWVAFPAWQRSHLRLLKLPGKAYGLGPIEAGQAELRGALDLRNYAAHWFRDSTAVPQSAYMSTDAPLTKTEVDQYRSQMEKLHEDGRIPVLGNGIKINLTHLTPAEALWLEAQSHYSATIARLFGVPTALLDERSGGSETYSNQLDKRQSLLTQTLSSYIGEIESAFTQLLPLGQSARLDTSTLFAVEQGAASAADNTVVTSTNTGIAPAAQPTGAPDA